MATALIFQSSAYVGEADLAAIAQLINTCRVTDQQESRTSVIKLQESFADPQFDITRDLRLWRGANDDLMAVAELWRLMPNQAFLGVLHFDIHPQVRNTALADTVLQWAETRLREAGRSQSLPLVLHSWCRDVVEQRRSLLMQLGFAPERYFLQLRRSLQDTPILSPVIPEGWQVRAVDMAQEAVAWVDMFNQTFIDHWDHHSVTVEDIQYEASLSTYNPELDLVAVAPTGQLAAFCASEIDPERNARLGLQEGHVCLLGTRRGYRRMGLARSLLLANLRRLQAAGMTTATIGVDAENPSGALKLYNSVGFERYRSSTVFRKAVSR